METLRRHVPKLPDASAHDVTLVGHFVGKTLSRPVRPLAGEAVAALDNPKIAGRGSRHEKSRIGACLGLNFVHQRKEVVRISESKLGTLEVAGR